MLIVPLPADAEVTEMVVHVGGKMYGSFVVESSEAAGGVAANAPGGKPGAGPVEAKTRAGFFQAPIPNVIHLFFDNPLLKPY
jgi:hypothetical protein